MENCATRVLCLVWFPATDYASFYSIFISIRSSFTVSCRVFFALVCNGRKWWCFVRPTRHVFLVLPVHCQMTEKSRRHQHHQFQSCINAEQLLVLKSILTRMHHHLLKTLYSFHARWSLLMLLKTKLRSAKWWFRHVHLKRFPVGEISFRITEGLRMSLLYLTRSASSLPIVYVTVSFFLSCLCIAVFLRYCRFFTT